MFRFFFVLIVLMIYGLLFTEQRMEYREKTLRITELTQELEVLNARKQELTVLIETERNRLIKQARNIGKPLSPKDIVIVE